MLLMVKIDMSYWFVSSSNLLLTPLIRTFELQDTVWEKGGDIYSCAQQSKCGMIINVWFNVQQPPEDKRKCSAHFEKHSTQMLFRKFGYGRRTRRLFLLGRYHPNKINETKPIESNDLVRAGDWVHAGPAASRSLTWCPGWTKRRWMLAALRRRLLPPGTPSGPQNPLRSRRTKSEASWPGSIPHRSPLPLLRCPPTQSATLALGGMSGPGSLKWQASRTKRPVSLIVGWTMWGKIPTRRFVFSYYFFPEDSVAITFLTFRIRTAKQKQLMGGASHQGASRLAVSAIRLVFSRFPIGWGASSLQFIWQLRRWLRGDRLSGRTCDWLANDTISLITRKCFHVFIGLPIIWSKNGISAN